MDRKLVEETKELRFDKEENDMNLELVNLNQFNGKTVEETIVKIKKMIYNILE